MRLGSRKPRLHGLLCRNGGQYLILGLSGLTLSVFSKDRREGGTLSADSSAISPWRLRLPSSTLPGVTFHLGSVHPGGRGGTAGTLTLTGWLSRVG